VRRIGAGTTSTAREASTANVAIVDTGIDLGHPDLNAAGGTNCVTPGAPADDDNGHGTHVAGTVGARNDGAGVLGVAPGTRMYAVKVLDAAGSGSYAAIICGIDWVTSTRTDADPGNDVAVANLSLGGPGAPVGTCATTTDPLHRAMCASIAAGVTYVVAAGNDGWDFDYAPAPDTPAAYPEALTVTAMSDSDGAAGAAGGAPTCATGETDDRAATFSNFAATGAGAAHIIAAPGVCVRSTWPGGGTRTISGTSMATPHVAGAVALCIGEAGRAGPCAGMTPSQIVARMRSDAQANTSTTAGFTGDPTRPFAGASFGYLAWAAASEATAPATDATAPSAGAVSPGDGATGVATTAAVTVAFSEPMDKGSAQAAFSLTRTADGATVAGTFSWGQDTMTFRPSAALSEGTAYTAKVGPGARDVAGNGLSAPSTWGFRTLTTVTVTPFATAIESGSLRSGTYTRLAADDNVFYEVTSSSTATRTSSWYARFTGVAQDLRSLRVLYRGRNSATCAQTVSIWRWTTSSWVQLDSRSVGSTEVLVDRSASATLADFVSASGEARVRVRCTSTTQGFYSRGDQLRLVHTRP
jgi:subtilisin family serine protease